MRRVGIFLMAWGVLAAGGAVVVGGAQLFRVARDAGVQWQAVDGEVIQALETSRRSGRVSVPMLSVAVRARLGEREVVDRLDAPARERARYTPGATVQVFVDPAAPDRLLLEPPSTGILLIHAIGVPAMLALGIGSIVAGRRLARTRAP